MKVLNLRKDNAKLANDKKSRHTQRPDPQLSRRVDHGHRGHPQRDGFSRAGRDKPGLRPVRHHDRQAGRRPADQFAFYDPSDRQRHGKFLGSQAAYHFMLFTLSCGDLRMDSIQLENEMVNRARIIGRDADQEQPGTRPSALEFLQWKHFDVIFLLDQEKDLLVFVR